MKENGTKDSFEVGGDDGHLKEAWFYKVVPDKKTVTYIDKDKKSVSVPQNYWDLANEKLLRFKQVKFAGTIKKYLYPVCDLFWRVDFKDVRYPDRSAIYVITGYDFEINENGCEDILKVAFLADRVENGTLINSLA